MYYPMIMIVIIIFSIYNNFLFLSRYDQKFIYDNKNIINNQKFYVVVPIHKCMNRKIILNTFLLYSVLLSMAKSATKRLKISNIYVH